MILASISTLESAGIQDSGSSTRSWIGILDTHGFQHREHTARYDQMCLDANKEEQPEEEGPRPDSKVRHKHKPAACDAGCVDREHSCVLGRHPCLVGP